MIGCNCGCRAGFGVGVKGVTFRQVMLIVVLVALLMVWIPFVALGHLSMFLAEGIEKIGNWFEDNFEPEL